MESDKIGVTYLWYWVRQYSRRGRKLKRCRREVENLAWAGKQCEVRKGNPKMCRFFTNV